MKLRLDELPVVGLAVLILASWAGAEFRTHSSPIVTPSPFLRVWAAYSASAALPLVAVLLAGLFVVMLVPLSENVLRGSEMMRQFSSAVRLTFPIWILFAVGSLALAIGVKGQYLLAAPAYLYTDANPALVSLSMTLQPASILAAGIVSTRRPTLGVGLAAVWTFVLFSSATRVFAGVIILFLLGRYLAGRRVRLTWWVLGCVYAFFAIPIPLLCRNFPAHGFLPYLSGIIDAVAAGGYFDFAIEQVADNIGFTIPLLVFTSRVSWISPADMLVELNPLPAAMVGWDRLGPAMRVHDFIPFSSMGEFASQGLLALFVFALWWGLIVRICISSVSTGRTVLTIFFVAAELGMAMISMVLTTQYNTRAVSRVLTMMILLAVAERVVRPMLSASFWRAVGQILRPRARRAQD